MTQRNFNRCAGLITAYMAVIFGLYLQMTPFYDLVALADGFQLTTQGCRNNKKLVWDVYNKSPPPVPPPDKKGLM